MASNSQNAEELKNLVVHTLETNGVLGQIRAQLRANVYKAIDRDEEAGASNVCSAKLTKSPIGRLMAEIVAEFFEFYEFRHSLSVFVTESNLGRERRSRAEVAMEAGLVRVKENKSILEQLVGLATGVDLVKGAEDWHSSASSTSASSPPPAPPQSSLGTPVLAAAPSQNSHPLAPLSQDATARSLSRDELHSDDASTRPSTGAQHGSPPQQPQPQQQLAADGRPGSCGAAALAPPPASPPSKEESPEDTGVGPKDSFGLSPGSGVSLDESSDSLSSRPRRLAKLPPVSGAPLRKEEPSSLSKETLPQLRRTGHEPHNLKGGSLSPLNHGEHGSGGLGGSASLSGSAAALGASGTGGSLAAGAAQSPSPEDTSLASLGEGSISADQSLEDLPKLLKGNQHTRPVAKEPEESSHSPADSLLGPPKGALSAMPTSPKTSPTAARTVRSALPAANRSPVHSPGTSPAMFHNSSGDGDSLLGDEILNASVSSASASRSVGGGGGPMEVPSIPVSPTSSHDNSPLVPRAGASDAVSGLVRQKSEEHEAFEDSISCGSGESLGSGDLDLTRGAAGASFSATADSPAKKEMEEPNAGSLSNSLNASGLADEAGIAEDDEVEESMDERFSVDDGNSSDGAPWGAGGDDF